MKRQNEIIALLVSIFIVVIVWIVVSIYHNANASTINDELTQDIIDISPTFNTSLFDKLKTRTNIDPEYMYPAQQGKNNVSNTISASSSALLDLTVNPSSQSSNSANQPSIVNTQAASNSGVPIQ